MNDRAICAEPRRIATHFSLDRNYTNKLFGGAKTSAHFIAFRSSIRCSASPNRFVIKRNKRFAHILYAPEDDDPWTGFVSTFVLSPVFSFYRFLSSHLYFIITCCPIQFVDLASTTESSNWSHENPINADNRLRARTTGERTCKKRLYHKYRCSR